MRFQSGKHAGKLSEVVFLKQPDFVEWSFANHPSPLVKADFVGLRDKFDAKPFARKCDGCSKPATRASAYANTSSLMFWCDDCDPYDSGARDGVLTTVRTFRDAMRHVNGTCNSGHRTEKRSLIIQLARAKGLPGTVTEKAALAFFA